VLTGKAPSIGAKMELELTIPPGEGHFPYAGKVRGTGTVLRCGRIPSDQPRWGVAARFDEPLALDFK